jgi:hypothetical protein
VLASSGVDAEGALAHLVDVSRDVESAAVLGADGNAAASTLGPEPTPIFAAAVHRLVAAADAVKPGDAAALVRVEARLRNGSLFVVRVADRLVAATTGASPPAALVFHDLESCLRSIEERGRIEAVDAPA